MQFSYKATVYYGAGAEHDNDTAMTVVFAHGFASGATRLTGAS
jgi:hypothetical protein